MSREGKMNFLGGEEPLFEWIPRMELRDGAEVKIITGDEYISLDIT